MNPSPLDPDFVHRGISIQNLYKAELAQALVHGLQAGRKRACKPPPRYDRFGRMKGRR